ncbi:MAG: hypothetical protein AB7S38_23460 [Vulcanimicrobiota bacterium]
MQPYYFDNMTFGPRGFNATTDQDKYIQTLWKNVAKLIDIVPAQDKQIESLKHEIETLRKEIEELKR